MPRRTKADSFALDDLARAQSGVVTAAQLEQLRLPRTTLLHRSRAGGPWQRLLPGVYLTNSGVVTPRQRAVAALAYSGPDALLTGAEALRRHGFGEGTSDGGVHVLIPDAARRLSVGFVLVERTRRLPDPVLISGLPCAPTARAVIDACRRMTVERPVRALVAEAVQRRRCTVEDLATELREGSCRGSRLPRRAIAEVAAGVHSVAEGDALRLIRASTLPAPSWNVDVYTDAGVWIARPDAWWDDHGVALEIDSRAWHLSPDDWERTVRRHSAMTALGIAVLHVVPARLRDDPAGVVAEIRGALEVAERRGRPAVRVLADRAALTFE